MHFNASRSIKIYVHICMYTDCRLPPDVLFSPNLYFSFDKHKILLLPSYTKHSGGSHTLLSDLNNK